MAGNPNSILDSVKKVLGLERDYVDFDIDVVMHINTCFGFLNQLGLGPTNGYAIEDNRALWSDYTTNIILLSPLKSYIYQRVRLLFDPPNTSFALDSMQKIITEFESRLNMIAESITPPSDPFTGTTPTSPVAVAFWWDLTGGLDFPDEAIIGDLGIDFDTGNVYQKAE